MIGCRVHQAGIGFNTVDISKARQAFKKEAVAASDVEDLTVGLPCFAQRGPPQLGENQLLPGPPPPVSLVELAVLSCVLTVHSRGSFTTLSMTYRGRPLTSS